MEQIAYRWKTDIKEQITPVANRCIGTRSFLRFTHLSSQKSLSELEYIAILMNSLIESANSSSITGSDAPQAPPLERPPSS